MHSLRLLAVWLCLTLIPLFIWGSPETPSLDSMDYARNPTLDSMDVAHQKAMFTDSGRVWHFFPYLRFEKNNPFVDVSITNMLIPEPGQIKKRVAPGHLLVFFVLLNIAFFLGIIKVSQEKKLNNFLATLFSPKHAYRYFQEYPSPFQSILIWLNIIIVLIISLGVYLYVDLENLMTSEIPGLKFIVIFITISGILIGKLLILLLLGYLFEIEKMAVIHHTFTIGYYFLATITFLPFFLINYLNNNILTSSGLWTTGIVILLITLIFRVLRTGFSISSVSPYPTLYLFLYLCTLEICPWVVFVALILKQ